MHSVGGWAALAGVIVLGPRLGKYVDGKIRPVAGHSMPLATIGVFLLWLGWYGFNGGSVLSADPGLVSLVFVTTSARGGGRRHRGDGPRRGACSTSPTSAWC